MAQFRKGDVVYDKCTGDHGKVVSYHTRRDEEGRWVTYYLLEGVPVSPNYPTGWRYHAEVGVARDGQ